MKQRETLLRELLCAVRMTGSRLRALPDRTGPELRAILAAQRREWEELELDTRELACRWGLVPGEEDGCLKERLTAALCSGKPRGDSEAAEALIRFHVHALSREGTEEVPEEALFLLRRRLRDLRKAHILQLLNYL